jgi:hypothetical protein
MMTSRPSIRFGLPLIVSMIAALTFVGSNSHSRLAGMASRAFSCSEYDGQVVRQPTDSTSSPVIGAPQQESVKLPEIQFIENRPFPFRMELTSPPEPPAVLELTPTQPNELFRGRISAVLHSAFAKYPTGTLKKVNVVIVGGTLTMNSQPAGGSYLPGIVFLATGEQDAGKKTDDHFATTFHHEVSSLLLLANAAKFDRVKFEACLPEGFVYHDVRSAKAASAPRTLDDGMVSIELLEEGFLVPWAKWNMEQDFNSYAEVLMHKPSLLLKTFAPESRVGRKARIVRDFYLKVDPLFEDQLDPDVR